MQNFFLKFSFHPVIDLPKKYEVFDFTKGYDPDRKVEGEYGIGKYNEKRPGMYEGDLYSDKRDIHMGVDIMAPIGTPVHAFYDGEIHSFANNSNALDYGYTLITKHQLAEKTLYALYGHLGAKSIDNKIEGQKIAKGDVIAWVGPKEENGGWNPHLHFQLSWLEPKVADMPGVVHNDEREQALEIYPDPQFVLGKLY